MHIQNNVNLTVIEPIGLHGAGKSTTILNLAEEMRRDEIDFLMVDSQKIFGNRFVRYLTYLTKGLTYKILLLLIINLFKKNNNFIQWVPLISQSIYLSVILKKHKKRIYI